MFRTKILKPKSCMTYRSSILWTDKTNTTAHRLGRFPRFYYQKKKADEVLQGDQLTSFTF